MKVTLSIYNGEILANILCANVFTTASLLMYYEFRNEALSELGITYSEETMGENRIIFESSEIVCAK